MCVCLKETRNEKKKGPKKKILPCVLSTPLCRFFFFKQTLERGKREKALGGASKSKIQLPVWFGFGYLERPQGQSPRFWSLSCPPWTSTPSLSDVRKRVCVSSGDGFVLGMNEQRKGSLLTSLLRQLFSFCRNKHTIRATKGNGIIEIQLGSGSNSFFVKKSDFSFFFSRRENKAKKREREN